MSLATEAAAQALDNWAWVTGESFLGEHDKIDGLIRDLHELRQTLPGRVPERPEEEPEEVEGC